MRKRIHIPITTLFLFILQASQMAAQRGPEKVDLNTYIKDAKKIAIAKFTGYMDTGHPLTSPYLFTVEQSLKGDFEKNDIFLDHKRGYIRGGFNIGDKCIIFINDGSIWMQNQLEYLDLVGKYQDPKNGTSPIIYIEDFYDSTNIRTHWDMEGAYRRMKEVVPQSLTEKQLRSFITDGKYQSHVKGYVHFFSEKTQMMEPSTLEIKIDIGYTKKELSYTVITSFNTNDFPAKPEMNVFDFGYLGELVYNGEGTRPLTIAYQFLESDSTGENIEAQFWIEAPEEITEKEFLDYLSNPSYGPPYFEFELVTSNKSAYQLIRWDNLHQGIELTGFMNQTFSYTRMSPPNPEGGELEMKYGEDELIIKFKPRPEKKVDYPYIQDHFVREAKIAPIEATLTWKKNGMTKELGTCTIYYKKTKFASNPNYIRK